MIKKALAIINALIGLFAVVFILLGFSSFAPNEVITMVVGGILAIVFYGANAYFLWRD